jgi:hypothetical protein
MNFFHELDDCLSPDLTVKVGIACLMCKGLISCHLVCIPFTSLRSRSITFYVYPRFNMLVFTSISGFLIFPTYQRRVPSIDVRILASSKDKGTKNTNAL